VVSCAAKDGLRDESTRPFHEHGVDEKAAVTFIDGDKGIALSRIPIEQLAEKSSFVETAYLLIYWKNLPNEDQLKDWSDKLTRPLVTAREMKHFFEGFSAQAHPMADLEGGMVSALPATTRTRWNPDNIDQRDITIARLVSERCARCGVAYKKSDRPAVRVPKNRCPTAKTSST